MSHRFWFLDAADPGASEAEGRTAVAAAVEYPLIAPRADPGAVDGAHEEVAHFADGIQKTSRHH